MATANIIGGLFEDLVPSVRRIMRGETMVDDEPMPSRLVKPEIMTGATGTGRVLEMDEFQGIQKAQREENLAIAYKMAEEGEDNRDIAARTGFGFYEGKPMLEIDDDAAELARPLTEVDTDKTYDVTDIIKHDDFFKVYPELKDTKVSFFNGDPKEEGLAYFDYDNKEIGLNVNAPAVSRALQYEDPGADAFKALMETVLHESQHAVQQIEKLPGGGNPDEFMAGGVVGLDLTSEEAEKRYRKLIGEMWARNIALRFRGKDKGTSAFSTLGTDDESKKYGIKAKDAVLESGVKTNPFAPFENVNYQDPFPAAFERTID
jgi:hypothetical protein